MLQCFSPAKINLILRVGNKRKDQYHEIESLMLKLNFGDDLKIKFKKSKFSKIEISCPELSLEPQKNLAYKAVRAFEKETNSTLSCHIRLKKRIPTEAGLAGGSSNAASVLKACALFCWGKTWSQSQQRQLHKIASSLGSDLNLFLLKEAAAWCTGRGEICRGIELPKMHFVLVFPKTKISTALAYSSFKSAVGVQPLAKTYHRLKGPPDWFKQDFQVPALENDFEAFALESFPELKRLKRDLRLSGALAGQMTGSGSAFFGVYATNQKARKAAKFLSSRAWNCRAAESLSS